MSAHGPTDWSLSSTPAVATAASVSKAAIPGPPAQRHICTSISFTISAVAIQGVIIVALRDGATGVGAILWSKQVSLAAGTIWECNLTDLSIAGTNGNAMTLETTSAPAGTNFASVAMTGYDSA